MESRERGTGCHNSAFRRLLFHLHPPPNKLSSSGINAVDAMLRLYNIAGGGAWEGEEGRLCLKAPLFEEMETIDRFLRGAGKKKTGRRASWSKLHVSTTTQDRRDVGHAYVGMGKTMDLMPLGKVLYFLVFALIRRRRRKRASAITSSLLPYLPFGGGALEGWTR